MDSLGQAIRSGPGPSAATALLREAKLPSADITAERLRHFFYHGAPAAPTGIVGLELYGAEGLLRSLVVAPQARSTGVGTILLRHAERYAHAQGVRNLHLLTTTAETYFARHGYQRIDRGQAPPAITATNEFTDLCPTNSTLMVKHL